jgi:uncharacterized protein with HEPN domain
LTTEKRRDAQRLEDMLKAVRDIEQETADLTRDQYASNATLQKAVAYDIMILGDAAAKMSQRTQKANTFVNWKALADYRNAADGPAHGYYDIDLAGTWEFVRDRVPELATKLRKVKVAPGPEA